MYIIYTIYSNIFVCVLFRQFNATCLTDITNVFKDKVQICTKLLTGAAAELSIDSRPRVVIHLFLYRAHTGVLYWFLSQTHDRWWAHITECKANSPSMCCSIKPLGYGYCSVSSQLICSDPNAYRKGLTRLVVVSGFCLSVGLLALLLQYSCSTVTSTTVEVYPMLGGTIVWATVSPTPVLLEERIMIITDNFHILLYITYIFIQHYSLIYTKSLHFTTFSDICNVMWDKYQR